MGNEKKVLPAGIYKLTKELDLGPVPARQPGEYVNTDSQGATDLLEKEMITGDKYLEPQPGVFVLDFVQPLATAGKIWMPQENAEDKTVKETPEGK